MISIVYLLRNNVNGKVYVGVTKNFKSRMRGHQKCYSKHMRVTQAILKHGWENFSVELLFEGEDHLARKIQEPAFIKLYDSKNPKKGYNATDGGEGIVGLKITDEMRENMAKAKRGKKQSKETVRKRSEKLRGKPRSEAARKSISVSLMGNQNAKGFKMSEESIKKAVQSRKKIWSFTSPSGDIVDFHGFIDFCAENDFKYNTAYMNFKRKGSYKEWTLIKIC